MPDLKTLIREVPDFPKPGILFYDITTLLKDKTGFRGVIDGLKEHYVDTQVDVVLGIEARGFIFAPALAYALGAGFVPVRKPKKLPAECVHVTYDLEYGTDTLEMHRDAVGKGDRVLIVDDLLATGGTAAAAGRMVQEAGGVVVGLGFVVELTFLSGRGRLTATTSSRCCSTTNERPMSRPRRARVRALAKINLDLRVLGKRPDGFHELRTVFQTISLADTLDIAFTPARKTSISLVDDLQIADNLVVRAARLVMEAMRVTGQIEMRLTKRIPMGAGLGGGSSDAAAVLLALPALAGRGIDLQKLSALGEQLGSDVPFFLLGGTAVGIGRGTELFPLPDTPAQQGILVAPGIHVNTAQAYRDLSPRLTTELQQNKIFSFQSVTWDTSRLAGACNDFEAVYSSSIGSWRRSRSDWCVRVHPRP